MLIGMELKKQTRGHVLRNGRIEINDIAILSDNQEINSLLNKQKNENNRNHFNSSF